MGFGMDTVAIELIKILAPTLADKVFSKIEGKSVKREDLFLATLCILAEQNGNIAKGLEEMRKQMVALSEGMNAVLQEIKVVNEGVTVLLKRTAP